MSSLGRKIKERIAEQDVSVHALEKKAGLKPSAIQNIIYGRSKNPSITLIHAIARALNCNIEDLVDEKEADASGKRRDIPPTVSKIDSVIQNRMWDQNLYLKCFDILNFIINQYGINIEKNKILDIVDEIYNYSLINKLKEPDIYFSNWLISNLGSK